MAGPSGGGHEHWSSRFAFLMAAIGSSVGLGNLWRFSAEAGENGGGAFVLIYLLSVFLVGMPILMGEYIIGRGSNAASAVKSVEEMAERSGVSKRWNLLGWFGMVSVFLVGSFYCVVAAWVLAYIPKFLFGQFSGMDEQQIAEQFTILASDPHKVIWWFTAFVALTAWLVSRGVHNGIEWASKMLMPMFFFLLVALAVYGLASSFNTPVTVDGNATTAGHEALGFLFAPDFSKISIKVVREALGQAFFSIGIGAGIMITYGSYLQRNINIPRSTLIVALSDTAVALIAGIAIFPIVFAHGLAPNSGAGLFFETLPIALVSVPGGQFVGAAFFFLAIFAAITSSISLLEVITAYVQEKTQLPRKEVTWALAFFMWAVGGGVVHNTLAKNNYLDFLNDITSVFLLPVGGLMIALFVGWRLKKSLLDEELEGTPPWLRGMFMFQLRFIAPVGVGIVGVWGVWDKYIAPMLGS